MTKVYLKKLSRLISDLEIEDEVSVYLETKHFFSGAALYSNKEICASWSPGGLAFKILESDELIFCGKAKPLRYYENGRIYKGYAMFEKPELTDKNRWKQYFIQAIHQRTLALT